MKTSIKNTQQANTEQLNTVFRECQKCQQTKPITEFERFPTGTHRHVCNKCKYIHYSLPAHWRWCMKK